MALDVAGSAWSWGRGEWGRLGHGDSSDCYEPTKIEGGGETHSIALPKLTAAFGADAHSGCLTSSGEVYTWGRNENWQLGYEVCCTPRSLARPLQQSACHSLVLSASKWLPWCAMHALSLAL